MFFFVKEEEKISAHLLFLILILEGNNTKNV